MERERLKLAVERNQVLDPSAGKLLLEQKEELRVGQAVEHQAGTVEHLGAAYPVGAEEVLEGWQTQEEADWQN